MRARAAEHGYHRTLSYDELADATPGLTDGRGFDIVIDSVGGELRERVRPLLAVLGRHVVIGNAADQDIALEANHVWYESFTLAGYNLGGVLARRPDLLRAQLEEGLRLVADGTLRLDVEEIGWDGVVKAHEQLEGRTAAAKYVLRTS